MRIFEAPFWWEDFRNVFVPAASALLVGLASWAIRKINQVHVLVNSQRTLLVKQNAGLRSLLIAAGIPVPPELRSQFAPEEEATTPV